LPATTPPRANVSAKKPVAQDATTVPTANPLPSRTPTVPPTHTLVPTDTPIPTDTPPPTLLVFRTNTPPGGIVASATNGVPTLASINSPTPATGTLDPNGTPIPTWTPPPMDPSVQIADHYRFQRPISENGVNYLDRTYPYGGTSGGALQVHHGVDFANSTNTPILAVGDGVVYYAGDDLATMFGLSTNYYGNLVVIQHTLNSPEGQPVFTLYGHMQSVEVQTGQAVHAGDVIGKVGATGVAFGPHLHLEVRIGDPQSFGATRNPDLWIYPYRRFGTLAGRVTDASGNILYQATVQIRSETRVRYAFTYADTSVNGDDGFHENYAYGDLPDGYYEVSVNDGQRVRFRKMIYVYPNQTTWLDIQLN
jgi:murein DD-endopeptidase MepM/ murein hydrolase activator NlpD